MTDADRLVVSFAAAFAPERGPALLSRLSGDASESSLHAARAAAAPRAERLRSLSRALALVADPARAEAAAALERPAVAETMRAIADGVAAAPASPVLVRLCRELLFQKRRGPAVDLDGRAAPASSTPIEPTRRTPGRPRPSP